MFERFTESARLAVVHARDHAEQRNDPRIATAHLLLGASTADDSGIDRILDSFGLTADVLEELLGLADGQQDLTALGVDFESISDAADAAFGEGALSRAESFQERGRFSRRRSAGYTRFTDGARACLERSLRIALEREDAFICSAHIAIAAVLTRESSVAGYLVAKKIDIPELQTQLASCVRDPAVAG